MRLYATIVFVGAFSTWKIAIAEKWYLESSFVSQDLTHNPLRELPQTHTRIRSKAMERGPGRRIFSVSANSLINSRNFVADHIVDELNTWLQRSTEGNVAHELTWAMTQFGPSNQDTHCATAKCRYNTVQVQ